MDREVFRFGIDDWPRFRRERWPELCIVGGAALLVWGISAFGIDIHASRFLRNETGIPLADRIVATIGVTMMAVGLLARKQR